MVITPLIDKSFAYLTASYNKQFDKNLEVEANYNPHKLFTNIEQLSNQSINLRDRTLVLNPPLEVIKIGTNTYFGFELHNTTRVSKLHLKLAPISGYKNLELEVSVNGKDWMEIKTNQKNDMLEASINKTIKYIRIKNASTETLNTKIEHFKVLLK